VSLSFYEESLEAGFGRPEVYVFGEYMLDVRRRELRRGGEPLKLEPQVFDLLAYLVRHRDRVVGKDDLLQAVWGGRIVSDSTLTARINAARRAIGDDGEKQRLIRTLPRKGVRFVAKITETPDGPDPRIATAHGMVCLGQSLIMSDQPSITVLPFTNIGGDPEQEHFAAGIVEEIITALCRVRWLFVTARNSSFAYKAQTVDVRQVGRELGVRYVLDGAVRKSGDRLRISAQLLDVESGGYLWADRFDGAVADIFELQDRVAAKVAGVIEPTIETAEMERSVMRPTDDLTAHDLYLRALPGCYSCSAQRLLRALDLLERAIERDPGYGPALAAAAGCRQFLGVSGWVEDPAINQLNAVELARQALQADGHAPAVLVEAARVLAHFTEEIDSAITIIERALDLNPSYARGWYWNGWLRLFVGQPSVAAEHFRTAVRLNPLHRPYLTGIGAAHFFSRRYREAAEALTTSSVELPGWPTTYRFLAASYVHSGRLEKARETFDRLRAITPAAVPRADCSGSSPFRNGEQSTLYSEGLRSAAAAA
jgi:TolB-like protein/DNA-binding winged helix-turn-helix (wHTH) protein